MSNIIDKEILNDNIELVHIEEFSINKIKRCLNVYDNPLDYIKNIILSNDSRVIKNGSTYYVSLKNVMLSIDADSFKVVSAALV